MSNQHWFGRSLPRLTINSLGLQSEAWRPESSRSRIATTGVNGPMPTTCRRSEFVNVSCPKVPNFRRPFGPGVLRSCKFNEAYLPMQKLLKMWSRMSSV